MGFGIDIEDWSGIGDWDLRLGNCSEDLDWILELWVRVRDKNWDWRLGLEIGF